MALSSEEARRVEVLNAVIDKNVSVRTAAQLLDRSERQIYRMLARLRRHGPEGIAHGNKGRKPLNKIAPDVWERVLELVRTEYAKLNDTQILRLLRRRHHIVVSQESLRKRLREAGIPAKSRRESKATASEAAETGASRRPAARTAHHQ